jgi:outer membrane protein OmpA-like peptidoglycan-associated protein
VRRVVAGARAVALAALVATVLGCPSAYQRTYDQTTERLEAQAQAERASEQAAHAEASRYAAVVYFPVGSATLDDDARHQLRWFVGKMQPYPQAGFLVQGFADSTGSEARNQGLSQDRAQAVATYLQSQGIAADRMAVQGFGTQSPAATNASAKGRRNNRRVEVTVR